ncbi:hypothetical protein NSK_005760 [Nannochloropsis salina CCMP1776]|uniref:Uncharacterized protein n=1 Tax=Nannochloropsis salina CCMP1776 TaxID=1027361 RepID=A0A4D9CZZ9_9STRA|nr:hypothetical protein NSK_005760 [Nannochloropsis salina CCMP1776]|eukprot:TFJ82935.1 hypothetical protein NSK_005760 [Nannochloropsis salina CCMP1776]
MSNRVQEALGEGEDLREGGEESWTGEEGGNKQEDGAAVERLYGDHVEILHRSFIPEDKPNLRLLEIWFEGFETFHLYSRYQFTKKGKQGDLTPEVIEEMCTKIDYAMYLDATGDYGPL